MLDGPRRCTVAATSGATATLATQPVDLVITRLQAGTARSISGAIASEPLTAMWRGMGPLLAVQPISNALMFVGYGAGKNYAERNGGSSLLPVFFGGCAGGFAQSLAPHAGWQKAGCSV